MGARHAEYLGEQHPTLEMSVPVDALQAKTFRPIQGGAAASPPTDFLVSQTATPHPLNGANAA
jgi:hypothetical protein